MALPSPEEYGKALARKRYQASGIPRVLAQIEQLSVALSAQPSATDAIDPLFERFTKFADAFREDMEALAKRGEYDPKIEHLGATMAEYTQTMLSVLEQIRRTQATHYNDIAGAMAKLREMLTQIAPPSEADIKQAMEEANEITARKIDALDTSVPPMNVTVLSRGEDGGIESVHIEPVTH